jgi:hypothetical protein
MAEGREFNYNQATRFDNKTLEVTSSVSLYARGWPEQVRMCSRERALPTASEEPGWDKRSPLIPLVQYGQSLFFCIILSTIVYQHQALYYTLK